MNNIITLLLWYAANNSLDVRYFGEIIPHCLNLEKAGLLLPQTLREHSYCNRCDIGCLCEARRKKKRDGTTVWYYECEENPRWQGRRFTFDPMLLRQWRLDLDELFRRLAAKLELQGPIMPVVPGFAWHIGSRLSKEYHVVVRAEIDQLRVLTSEYSRRPDVVLLTRDESVVQNLQITLSNPMLVLEEYVDVEPTGEMVVNVAGIRELAGEKRETSIPFEFRRRGQVWVVRFEGKDMFLKDGKGPRYIALLLSKPDAPIFAADLQAIAAGKDPEKVHVAGAAGTMSDRETLRDVEKEFRSLQAELARARADGDVLVEQEVLDEMRKLEEYIRKATDGRGKLRKLDDDCDNHRQSVFRAIDRTIDEIATELPNCGVHLRNRIRTGTEVVYESENGVAWVL